MRPWRSREGTRGEQDGRSVDRVSWRPQGEPRPLKCWDSFDKAIADAEGFNAPEGYTNPPIRRGGGGPPASSGRGMQEERRRRTWEAPDVPAVENIGVWHTAPEARKGKPGHGTMLEPAHRCGPRPGRWRSPVTGQTHSMRMGSRIEQSTLRWGKPTTRGRSRRKHAARKGHASRTCRTGSA